MRTSLPFIAIILFSSIYQVVLSKNENRIKKCEYSSLCLEQFNEISIEIFFNIPPKTVTQGEITHYDNSTLKYISKPKITKQNTVIFKFTPEYIGSYSFHFNHNLRCPLNKLIIVKRPIQLIKMPKSLFISEQQKMAEYSFNMFFEFDYDIEVNKDKGDIRGFALGETGTGEEMIMKPISNCNISHNDTRTVICSNIKHQLSGNAIGFYYYDKCNVQNTLGFLSVIISSSSALIKPSTYPSLMTRLQPHYIKQYQKDKVILVTFIISSEKRNDIDVLYSIAAPLSDKYSEFVFSFAEYEKDSYLILHFDLKNDEYVKIVIYDFPTENLFIENVHSIEQIEGYIIALSKNELEWTSQNVFRWILTKIGIKLRRDKEQCFYFVFCSFCFFFLIVLRCYLVNKKRPKEPNASFGYNTKKTD